MAAIVQITPTHIHTSREKMRTVNMSNPLCFYHTVPLMLHTCHLSQNTLYTSTPHILHITLNLFFPSVYLFSVAQNFRETFYLVAQRKAQTHTHRAELVVDTSIPNSSKSRCIKMQSLFNRLCLCAPFDYFQCDYMR